MTVPGRDASADQRTVVTSQDYLRIIEGGFRSVNDIALRSSGVATSYQNLLGAIEDHRHRLLSIIGSGSVAFALESSRVDLELLLVALTIPNPVVFVSSLRKAHVEPHVDWLCSTVEGHSFGLERKTPSLPLPEGAVAVATAGTTGLPKLVLHTRSSLLHAVLRLQLYRARLLGLSLGRGSVTQQIRSAQDFSPVGLTYCSVAPLWSIAGMTVVLQALMFGETLALLQSPTAGSILDALSSDAVTNLSLVPFIAAQMIRRRGGCPIESASLLHVGIGGAACHPAVAERLEELVTASVTIGYGSTEAGGAISISNLDDPPNVRHASIGRALPLLSTRVDDAGELYVRSPSIASAYLDVVGRHDVLDEDGWWHSGDLVEQESDGVLHHRGRKDLMIIRGGMRIDPVAIEQALETHPDVVGAGVYAHVSSKTGEPRILAAIETGTHTPALADLVERCRRLAGYAPQHVDIVSELPRTPDGSPRRHLLQAIVEAEAGAE